VEHLRDFYAGGPSEWNTDGDPPIWDNVPVPIEFAVRGYRERVLLPWYFIRRMKGPTYLQTYLNSCWIMREGADILMTITRDHPYPTVRLDQGPDTLIVLFFLKSLYDRGLEETLPHIDNLKTDALARLLIAADHMQM
jgi:hypothetical protein